MLSYVMRDFVDSWYKKMTDDELFKESLKRTARRSIGSLSQWLVFCYFYISFFKLICQQCVSSSMRQVDWVPFFTRHVVDDFASHLRLYRMASEKFKFMGKKGWLGIIFFLRPIYGVRLRKVFFNVFRRSTNLGEWLVKSFLWLWVGDGEDIVQGPAVYNAPLRKW